ncbi:MAG: hypothetical protein JKY37_30745, partial [Nannocystaceae bacterium]|nr:hypothetical protein [Nannocystaceae bacterium]
MADRDLASPSAIDRGFLDAVGVESAPSQPEPEMLGELDAAEALQAFDAMLISRHVDFVAMALRKKGVGYYTIGSAGHEGNVAVAAALRTDDPAFLHYRSGGFFLERAARAGYEH